MNYYIISEEDLNKVEEAAQKLFSKLSSSSSSESIILANQLNEVCITTKQFKYNYGDYDPEPTEDIQKDLDIVAREFGGEF